MNQQEKIKSFSHPLVVIDANYPRKKQVRRALELILKESRCPNCGALLPELSFTMDGKQFDFVCHEVSDTEKIIWDGKKETHQPRKVLASTDYPKLLRYLKKRLPIGSRKESSL